MPTIFSICDECNYLDCLPINHNLNKIYYNQLQIVKILNYLKLATEIAIKIIKYNDEIRFCTGCKGSTKLCNIHFEKALINGSWYNGYGALCDNCFMNKSLP